MVDIKMKGRQANIGFCGSPKDVAMEISAAISGIYQGIHDMDPEDAVTFKHLMQRSLEDGSPVWERKHELTMLILPTIK